MDKDVLSVVHQYIGARFDLPFLKAELPLFLSFLTKDNPTDDGMNDWWYYGHDITHHILSDEIDMLVIKEHRQHIRSIGDEKEITVERGPSKATLCCKAAGLMLVDLFRTMEALFRCNYSVTTEYLRRVDIIDTSFQVDTGKRVLTLSVDFVF